MRQCIFAVVGHPVSYTEPTDQCGLALAPASLHSIINYPCPAGTSPQCWYPRIHLWRNTLHGFDWSGLLDGKEKTHREPQGCLECGEARKTTHSAAWPPGSQSVPLWGGQRLHRGPRVWPPQGAPRAYVIFLRDGLQKLSVMCQKLPARVTLICWARKRNR